MGIQGELGEMVSRWSLNTMQIQAIATMVGESISLIRGYFKSCFA